MEVYIELTYIINEFIFVIVFEMISILLNVNWSMKKIVMYSFSCNISLILIYIDYVPYISLLYWLFLFLLLFKKQCFLYFPVYLIVYFSILLFINTLIENSFVYNGILITPTYYTDIAFLCVVFIFCVIEVMYLTYIKKKIIKQQYLYEVDFVYAKSKYHISGFLDSGNEAYYQGFPLIFIKKGIIQDYQRIDTYMVHRLDDQIVDIICIDELVVNHQQLHNVYAGIIDDIHYECLLNKDVMGGVI